MATNNSDILIYDNRTKDFGSDVSRAVRFNIDEQTRTATQTWEAITPKFTGFFGDVDELSGGNVLICTQEYLIWVQPLIHLHISLKHLLKKQVKRFGPSARMINFIVLSV